MAEFSTLAPPTKDNEKVEMDTLTRVNTHSSKVDLPVEKGIEDAESRYLTGKRLVLVHTGVLLAVLLVSLPKLSSQFNALDQLTWIVSAYFLTQAGLMLTFGQILTIAPSKYVFLFAISVFEIGSLLCGVAPTIEVLIFGRAVEGVGSSGGFIAVLTIISQVAKLETRPILLGSFGAVFGFASVIGPLVGGVFTDKLTWRWCFYINLPFGAISILVVFVILPVHPPLENSLNEGKTTLQKWMSLDWVGTFLSLTMTTTLFLPLQWGGVTRPWNDKVVIALFVVSGILFIAFVSWERHLGDRARMPVQIFRRRTQLSAGITMFLIMTSFIVTIYYLPFFYQAKGRTASQSGIDIIPLMMAMVVGTGVSGYLIGVTGRHWIYLLIGPTFTAVGGGLLFTISENTLTANLIVYQIILGFGAGLMFNIPLIALQAEYADSPELIPQASSLLTFLQLLGAVIGISIAGSVFSNQISKELSVYASVIPPDILKAVKQSVTVIFKLPEAVVVGAYVNALDYAFIIGVACSGGAFIAGASIRNWNLKERGVKPGVAAV